MIDRGPSLGKVVTDLAAELPEGAWRDPRDYVLIDAEGNIKGEYAVTTWSIDDELGASVFAVIDGALRNLYLSVFYTEPIRIKRVEKIVLDRLRTVTEDDDKTWGALSDAFARYQGMLAEEIERQARLADARIAAIPGADEDYGVGDDFRRAQEVLGGRVKAYGDKVETEMLRVLAKFGALHRSICVPRSSDEAARVAFAGALNSFVTACRLAAFDRSLGTGDSDPSRAQQKVDVFDALPARSQTEIRGLEKMLVALEHDLLQVAEGQEWSDARNNAMQMRVAAEHVACAREGLERGFGLRET